MKIKLSCISPALACVYELTPGKNNDNPILYIFNSDEEAKTFWDTGNDDSTDGYWFYIPKHGSRYTLHWNEGSKLACSEKLWMYISHYNGCTNETICTTTLLKKFINDEANNPYFERSEILPVRKWEKHIEQQLEKPSEEKIYSCLGCIYEDVCNGPCLI